MLRDLPPLGRRFSEEEQLFMNVAAGNQHENEHRNEVLDDIFGSAPSSPNLPSTSQLSGAERAEYSDVPRLRSIHVTNGYREGIAVSKEKYIQAGFDEGYSLGGEIGTKVGWCLGTLEGLWHAVRRVKNGDAQQKVQALHEQAQEELKMEKLLSPNHFGEDGIWLYDVPGQDSKEDELHVTFVDVANAHPVLKKWKDQIEGCLRELGLTLP